MDYAGFTEEGVWKWYLEDIGQKDGGCSASTCKIPSDGKTCLKCHWKCLMSLAGLLKSHGRWLMRCDVPARGTLNTFLLSNLPSLALLIQTQQLGQWWDKQLQCNCFRYRKSKVLKGKWLAPAVAISLSHLTLSHPNVHPRLEMPLPLHSVSS